MSNRTRLVAAVLFLAAPGATAQFDNQWVQFASDDDRLELPPLSVSSTSTEVDFAWGDLDHNGFVDLVGRNQGARATRPPRLTATTFPRWLLRRLAFSFLVRTIGRRGKRRVRRVSPRLLTKLGDFLFQLLDPRILPFEKFDHLSRRALQNFQFQSEVAIHAPKLRQSEKRVNANGERSP